MDSSEVRAVQDNMADLTKVRLNDVIDFVIEENLLSLSNLEEVSAKPTDTEKMRQLYYLICRCPRQGAFARLIQVLEQADYPWLAGRLETRLAEHRLRRENTSQTGPCHCSKQRDSGVDVDYQPEDSPDGEDDLSLRSPSDSPIFCCPTVSEWELRRTWAASPSHGVYAVLIGENTDEIVYVQHDSARLGLKVKSAHLYGRQGFLVTDLAEHGFGQSSGDLRQDDFIYSVDDTACSQLGVGALMDLLRAAAEGGEVRLGRVRPWTCWMEKRPIRLRRKGGDPFGFSLSSGLDRPRHEGDEGVYVAVVVPGSAADKAGLRCRDGVVAVSGHQVVDGTPVGEVEGLLRAVGADVCLAVQRRSSLGNQGLLL